MKRRPKKSGPGIAARKRARQERRRDLYLMAKLPWVLAAWFEMQRQQ